MSLSKAQSDPRLNQPVRDISRPAPDSNLVLLTKFLPGSKIPYFYYVSKDNIGGGEVTTQQLADSTAAARQSLSISSNLLTIEGGNTVALPLGGDVTTSQLNDSIENSREKLSIRDLAEITELRPNESIGSYHNEGGGLPTISSGASNNPEVYFSNSFTKLVDNKGVDSINYIFASEDIRTFSGLPPWTFINMSFVKDDIIGPFQSQAEKITLTNSSGQFRANSLDTAYQSIPLSNGDTVTISGYIKPGIESFNDNLSFQIGEILNAYQGSIFTVSDFDPTNKDWQFFELKMVYEGINPRKNLRFVFSGDTGDYFHITRLSYNIGSNSHYQKTNPQSRSLGNQVYAVYRPRNGKVVMDQVDFDPQLKEGQKLNEALRYCEQTGLAQTVVLTYDITTDTVIVVPEKVHIEGNGYTIRYNGNASSNPSDDCIIKLADTEDDAYADGHRLSNLKIVSDSTISKMLVFEECIKPIIEDVVFDGEDNVQYGLFSEDRAGGEATIAPYLVNVTLENFTHSAANLDRFNDSRWVNTSVFRNGYGLYFQRPQNVYFFGGSLEENDSTYFYMPNGSGKVVISHVYFEDTPDTSPSYRIDINNGDNVTISDNNFLAGGDATEPDANINLSGNTTATIKSNDFNAGGGEPLHTSSNTRWSFYDNSFNAQRLSDSISLNNADLNFDKAMRVEKRDSMYLAGEFIPTNSQVFNITIDAERSTVITGNTTGYWNVPDNLVGAKIVECQFAYKTAPTGGTSDLQLSNGSIGFFGQTMADGDRVHTTNNGGTPYTLQSEEIIQPLQASTTATTPGVGLIVNLTIVKN